MKPYKLCHPGAYFRNPSIVLFSGILFSQLFVYVVCRAYIIAGNISAADTSANKNIGAGAVGSKIFEDCRKSLKL